MLISKIEILHLTFSQSIYPIHVVTVEQLFPFQRICLCAPISLKMLKRGSEEDGLVGQMIFPPGNLSAPFTRSSR